MRTDLNFFAKYSDADRLSWAKQARSIEENLFDLTDLEDVSYPQDAIDQKLRWIWSLRRQCVAYDRFHDQKPRTFFLEGDDAKPDA